MLPLLSDFDQIKMTCNGKCDCYHDIQANPIKQVSNKKKSISMPQHNFVITNEPKIVIALV